MEVAYFNFGSTNNFELFTLNYRTRLLISA